ncbi:hypothetical protein K504DRAFT_460873 [Pleomassaria siparia CBS 279.74]|uniref:DUF7892 domain-containing protein n=1 Tax=Pleomassaria siparia CBS 279.74 TaxID=1314801 RepID=A0A6G1JXV6_9PLEO|nr:hypothetical protein K504DRAFT_460873 [Pleomassaria siparia CBS 279.74]
MEDREASIASSTDFYGSDRKPDTPARDAQRDSLPTKRKAEDDDHVAQDKRRRLETASGSSTPAGLQPCAGLPPAVWQHIFLSCPLTTLGRLLQVNRSFHSYLSDVRNVSPSKPGSGFLRLLKSESIWASARNAHPTKPPKPLPGFSELQMWQLLWSKKCQFCHSPNNFTPGDKIWHKGPSATGVRTIWPFGIRSCGPCLLQRCQTDASLLFSTASALRPALPFAFVTSDYNYIPAYTLQAATTPAGVEIGKYYYKDHVADMTKELEQALGRGSAAAEEWAKGLDARGKERMKAPENWERWEVKYQWWADHKEPKRAVSKAPSSVPSVQHQPATSPTTHTPSPVIYAPIPATLPHPYVQPRPPTIPPAVYTPQPIPGVGPQPPPRGERNLHDANEAKATRKADIERRCQLLNPPILPTVLRHMDSFKAAIQISQPMNDYAWSVLLPRLLAQFPAAQQVEMDHVSRVASVSTRAVDRRQQDASLKEVKEVLDREWEEAQRPIRDKLGAFADDFINQDWDHGRAVTYENSPKFAVDLLVYTRRMFYAQVAKTETASRHNAEAEAEAPKLVLENMKWVYDNKLKPLTEQFRKELFLCYGNGCEGNTRFYGFEGVIQHFGAKHTSTFSVGNVVVAWKDAEWPEETPFHPDPISVKHAYHAAPSTAAQGQSGYGYGGYSRAGTSTPHMQPNFPQASPNPHYGGHYNGPFAPPNTQSNTAQAYDHGRSHGAPMDFPYPSYPQMAPPPGFGSHATNIGYMTSPAMGNAAIAPPPAIQLQAQSHLVQNGPADTGGYRDNMFDKQVSTIIAMAQDIWKHTSGIKDLPNNLRVYVLLQRVISKFQIQFNHGPNLNHFIDALSSHQIPKALKHAPGLFCKACQGESSYQSSADYYTRREDRRTYTVLSLFSHFKAQHVSPEYGNGQPSAASLDWREDMIELPNDRFISGLIHAPGMDDEKLHMVATVFPRLFPTPLPRIGVVDANEVPSALQGGGASKDSKDAGEVGLSPEKFGPASLMDSSVPAKPSEDEYDPRRPALSTRASQSTRVAHRAHFYRGISPPSDRRPRYYAEPRYYVGGSQDPSSRVRRANSFLSQLPQDHVDDDYPGPREYMEYAPNPRGIREPFATYDDHASRRPLYREHETFHEPGPEELVYARSREGPRAQDHASYPQPIRYYEGDESRPEYRLVRPQSGEHSIARNFAEADRFLADLDPGPSTATRPLGQDRSLQPEPQLPAVEAEVEDGSRYTPPPPAIISADSTMDQHRTLAATRRGAPSTVSNGSRYDDYPPGDRQIPTPDSTNAQRRPGPIRRKEKQNEHVPSRYYRYMSVAREEPYARGASTSRAQHRRYGRYEEQRRRIDQQETPQPNADRDYIPAYSRNQSIDQGPPNDSYYPSVRPTPREYIPIQDRLHPSPSRVRYPGPSDEERGPPPVYVDEFGHPMHEYEMIRVPQNHRTARGPLRYSPEYESDHIQYVPISMYDRPLLPRHEGHGRPGEYVYYEERDRALPIRRPAFEPENEAPYEPPPDIKIDGVAPVPEGP